MFIERIKKKIALQKETGFYRDPLRIDERMGATIKVRGKRLLNFSSNDYLGLGSSAIAQERVSACFSRYAPSSSSSRIVTGNYELCSQAEKAYAAYFGYEDALFFPSGYQANLAVVATFLEQGDLVFYDKHIHASSVKGMALSSARFYGYNHNSISHLERRLHKNTGSSNRALLTEALFSMDGDLLKVDELKELKEKYRLLCVVDEAHSFGALGEGGRGIGRSLADIAIGTFGKAFGLFGAFVLLPSAFKEYLFNFASPLIYTTTLPEAHAAASLAMLELVRQSDEKRSRLARISSYMKTRLREEGYEVEGDAHILAIQIGDEKEAVALSHALQHYGLYLFVARFPTIPLGKAILRLSMSALHTEEDVDYFIKSLGEIYAAKK